MDLILKLISQNVTADLLGNAAYGIGNILTLGPDYIVLAKGLNVVDLIKTKLGTLNEVERAPVYFSLDFWRRA